MTEQERKAALEAMPDIKELDPSNVSGGIDRLGMWAFFHQHTIRAALAALAVPMDARLITHDGGVQLYQAPEGVKITATTEHGGFLYVALHHEGGKNEIVEFDLNKALPVVAPIEGLDEAIATLEYHEEIDGALDWFLRGYSKQLLEAARAYQALVNGGDE